jgi:hypothetical protein
MSRDRLHRPAADPDGRWMLRADLSLLRDDALRDGSPYLERIRWGTKEEEPCLNRNPSPSKH